MVCCVLWAWKGKLTFRMIQCGIQCRTGFYLWKENYGAETTHRMAQAGLEKRPFMVRFAENRAGKEEILASPGPPRA